MRPLLLLAGLLPALAIAQLAPAPPTLPPPANAVAPGNPYEALVARADPSPAGESIALREALATVLAAVTGLPDVRTQAAAAPILERSAQLVQHYGDEIHPATRAPMFRAAFDPHAVDEALKQQGLPVFGVVAGAQQDWPVEVRGVDNFRDYGRAVGGLQRARGVRSVQVQAAQGDRLLLLVRFEGDAQALARAAGADPAFHATSAPGAALQLTLRPPG